MFHISNNREENKKQLKGARVAVLGAARSGVALAELLAEAGASVLLSDVKPADQLQLPAERLTGAGIDLETGGHSPAVLHSDLIAISPGLPLTIPILREAAERRIPITGELEVASWFNRAPVVAITGSNGKTTTTTLTGGILRRRYPRTIVAGNIGQPFAQKVREMPDAEYTVLEISSFQLETIHSFHPRWAVLMNLVANHLDRYPDFEAYARAKLNILKNMDERDILIVNKDDKYLDKALRNAPPRKLLFSLAPHLREGAYWENEGVTIRIAGTEKRIELPDYHLRGPHNRYNMMVAALLGSLLGVPEDDIRDEIARFPGIEHRLETVRELEGVLYVNDSKATTVDSLLYALQSFDGKVVLIAGGKDKGGDFSRAGELLRKNGRAVILIGQAAERMAKNWSGVVPLKQVDSLQEAVRMARRMAHRGDVVLLSPACSSYDMFRDYEERGDIFKKLVNGLD